MAEEVLARVDLVVLVVVLEVQEEINKVVLLRHQVKEMLADLENGTMLVLAAVALTILRVIDRQVVLSNPTLIL